MPILVLLEQFEQLVSYFLLCRWTTRIIAARTQPCLTLRQMSNCSEEMPLNCIVPFESSVLLPKRYKAVGYWVWKYSIMLCSYGVNRTLVKRLSKINESEGKLHLLLYVGPTSSGVVKWRLFSSEAKRSVNFYFY